MGWMAAFFILAATALAAPEGVARFERTFADAAKAYDENRLPEAIAGWQALADEGQALPEVLFNLGNAYYRHGDLGEAILAYRRAQRLAPRDPDVRANLGFAAQSAGIELPARAGSMTVCVPLPDAGSYGIAVRHDVNGNGKTDLSSDGGGMSNNPSINIFNLGKPSYTKTAFAVGNGPRTITITMKYM